MQINRLRLLGFKSFVDPTELIVERGLTGVVGPNGCGKSNLLEALRWVMGETSHKSMRAAAMDDVIFAGTSSRPSRNSAEVTILVDNSARKAPAEFNDSDTIEITRRIEREAGSAYRINGRDARARDVKVLFEDAATGARSPALVRQGQIGEIVNAKPEQRRRILEDAAGIAGLHTRRHESELRLKAAESNLARLGDVLGGLNAQMEALKRQARAARRYKDLSGDIRKSEALLLHLAWSEAQRQVEAEETALAETTAKVGLATQAEGAALRAEIDLTASLQSLRETEAGRAAAFARLKVAQESLEAEARRASERQGQLEARRAELERDIARETGQVAEARETIERLADEIAALVKADDGAEEAEEVAASKVDEAEASLVVVERRLSELTHRAAEMRARRRSLEGGLAERKAAVDKLSRQAAALETQSREIAARAPDAVKLAETGETCDRLAAQAVEAERAALAAEAKRKASLDELQERRDTAAKVRLTAAQLDTEVTTLRKLLVPTAGKIYAAIVDAVTVAPGYETALGAALGEDLDAPADVRAPLHWRTLDPLARPQGLPDGAGSLADHVEAPPELARRLCQIGVVADAADGARLQLELKPGQRLVSRDGGLWRWDGYVAAAGVASPAAQRLAERNRLKKLERKAQSVRAEAEEAAEAAKGASGTAMEAEEIEREVREASRIAQSQLAAERQSFAVMQQAAREAQSRLEAVADTAEQTGEDLVEAQERVTEVELALEGIAEEGESEEELAAVESEIAERRAAAADARAALNGLSRERQMRTERKTALTGEHARWAARVAGTDKQMQSLAQRLEQAGVELAETAGIPQLISEKREALRDQLIEAEQQRQDAADRLAEAETAIRAAKDRLRGIQAELATEREARARTEARLDGARARRSEEGRRIRDTLQVAPEDCLKLAEVADGAELPPLVDVDRQLTRLKADRERLGGVNLQAEDELETLTGQFNAMETERADVEQAINKLRGAIGALNREARKRLETAFETVNGHFQRLFTTLFNGGEARLEMIESEDPLEGGLEIVAKPPGKKPATLSLLSGGEQTLTALSLIFAVFLTNPSPICVLDEVDAPLDDANVDRFCTLMEKMAEETDTRFLVITHHPMTMSRMHRLFGVTMAERGVSMLVSVDLQAAHRVLEAEVA
jgi:chromosome segregation protein